MFCTSSIDASLEGDIQQLRNHVPTDIETIRICIMSVRAPRTPSPYDASGPGLTIAAPKVSTGFIVSATNGRRLRVRKTSVATLFL